jgi:hypothetical protein
MMKNLPVLAEKISKYKNEKNKFHYAQHFFNFLHACCWRSNVRGQKSNYYSIQQYFTIFFLYKKKSLIFLYIFCTISLHFFFVFYIIWWVNWKNPPLCIRIYLFAQVKFYILWMNYERLFSYLFYMSSHQSLFVH